MQFVLDLREVAPVGQLRVGGELGAVGHAMGGHPRSLQHPFDLVLVPGRHPPG